MTAWRIPLSAHVCTTDDAPAVKHADVYLAFAEKKYDAAALLRKKWLALSDSPYSTAVHQGAMALDRIAAEYISEIQRRNALLHYSVPKATQLAEGSWERDRTVPTC